MHKLVWVALPLLAAAGWLLLQVLRGRTPSRQAVNMVSSLLLLAYVLTTAGLGIFWVANQQLPVFDWHYLFGYGTVLLLSLHLAFNLGLVWRFLLRRRRRLHAAGGSGDTQELPRRSLLGVVGGLLALGAAFVLGMRHGRTELRLGTASAEQAAGVASTADADARALVERFHAFSSHSRAAALQRAPSAEWGPPPPAFKTYAGAPRIPVPRAAPAGPIDAATLGAVLWHTAGVTAERGGLLLRASPSSGALFSTELYVASRSVAGIPAGAWHYDARGEALEHLAQAAAADAVFDAAERTELGDAAAIIVASAVFRRTGQKYRDRTYRYVWADLGHALENLRVAAGALGCRVRLVRAFDGARAARVLSLDEAEEGVLAMVALRSTQAGARAEPPPVTGPRWIPGAVRAEAASRLGVTAAVHAATALRTAPAEDAASAPLTDDPARPGVRLPAAEPLRVDMLRLIQRRRSVRRFLQAPLRLQDVSAVLSRMLRDTSPLLSDAVRVDVVVRSVTGLAPGAYRYEAARHVLLPRRGPMDLAAAAQSAALDQQVIGDAAAVLVLSIDRRALAADALGPARGYRHAFLEAGLVGERVYLEAGARNLGACAVGAFYDEEAAALVGIDPGREWVVHFAALGVPVRT
ncbi:MAG: SagB family peptide dehydrogenase [Pseudomonadota bacterium]